MKSVLFVGLLLGCAASVETAPITYQVNQTVGTGTVTGTIETDGTIGTITACAPQGSSGGVYYRPYCYATPNPENILAWDLVFDVPGVVTLEDQAVLNDPRSVAETVGTGLTATSTELLFDVSQPTASLTFASEKGQSPDPWWCLGDCGLGIYNESLHQPGAFASETGVIVLGTVAGPVSASVPDPIPEPATLLLFGSALVVLARERFRRRKG
jgi:hypothetical protein